MPYIFASLVSVKFFLRVQSRGMNLTRGVLSEKEIDAALMEMVPPEVETNKGVRK